MKRCPPSLTHYAMYVNKKCCIYVGLLRINFILIFLHEINVQYGKSYDKQHGQIFMTNNDAGLGCDFGVNRVDPFSSFIQKKTLT